MPTFKDVALYHNYVHHRGHLKGQPSTRELQLAIGSGEVATVLLADEERAMVLDFLNQQAEKVDDPLLSSGLASLARQIYAAIERERQGELQSDNLGWRTDTIEQG